MKIIILDTQFKQGTAGANRQLGYATAFASKGYLVEIISFGAFYYEEKIKTYADKISIRCLRSAKYKGNKYIKGLYAYLCLAMFLFMQTKKTDKLLVCGSEDFFPIIRLFKKGNLFYECTECPDVVGPNIISCARYIKYLDMFDRLFVISENLKTWFIDKGVNPSKLVVVNMIVDKNRFDGINPDNKCKYIAYCGSVSNKKDGVGDLIEAFLEYSKTFTDRQLFIIGPVSSKELMVEYNHTIESNNANGMIKFLGQVSALEMPKLLVNAEMLMLTRPDNIQAHYGFPTKLGEYLISTRPVVVTNVGNIGSFISNRVHACVVEPGNQKEIIDSMTWISNNPIAANEMAQKGRECALLNFDNVIEADKILKAMN